MILQIIYCTSSFAQSDCGAASIDSAEYRYGIGRFEECIEGLRKCLNTKKAFIPDERVQAFHLLAKCYLAVDSISVADSVIEELLLLKDNFETDPKDPERFKNQVLLVKSNTVSSVSKRNEDIRLAPATTTVITHEEILQRGYTDLIDVLKDVSGFDVDIYYGQLYANVYQRGLRTASTEKTLLLVDGVEDNDLWTNFADISQQYPLTNIKRIEIVYGPSSTMYGPNAFCGVINIITKEPADYLQNKKSFGINASTGIGSYNARYVDVSTAYRKGIFSFSVTGRLYKWDRPDLSSQSLWSYNPNIFSDATIYRYRQMLSISENGFQYLTRNSMPLTSDLYTFQLLQNTVSLEDPGINRAIQLNQSLYNQPSPYTKFSNPSKSSYINAKINVGDFSMGFVSWAKAEGIGTTYTDYFASVSGSVWRPAHTCAYFKYNKRLNEKLLFSTFLNYRIHTIRNGSKITTVRGYALPGGLTLVDLYNEVPATWLTTYYYEQSEQFRTEFKLLYNQSKYFSINSGVELRNSQLQGYYLTDTDSDVPENNGTSRDNPGGNLYNVNDIGVYSQANYRTKSGFGFTAGARLDYDKIRHAEGLGYNLSPRFVVDYKKNKWVFKALLSKGIENVSNYTKFNTVTILTPNPSLSAETIYNYEVSSSYKLSEVFSADAELYYCKVKDLVRTVSFAGSLQNQNVASARVKGAQANFYYRSANKKWNASLNYSYTNSKEIFDVDASGKVFYSNKRVWRIPRNKANAIINYAFLKNFNINLRANYIGTKKIIYGETLKPFNAYIHFNTALTAFNLIKGTSMQFICNNIFDKSYYSPGLRGDGILGPDKVFQMKRNFALRLNCEF